MSAAKNLEQHPANALGEITLAAFARDILGTKSAHAGRVGRDWCQARGVPYRRDGKVNWVRLDDVRKYLASRPVAGASVAANDVPDVGDWG